MTSITSEKVGPLGPPVKGIEDDVNVGHGGQLKMGKSDVLINNATQNITNVTTRDEQRRKKTRRARKPRANKRKPYSKLSWEDKAENHKDDNVRAKMFTYGLPEAPYNTTQFLMEDHNDLKDLDVKLQEATNNADGPRQRVGVSILQKPPRARDSSFSLDSDDDYFYSSPSDEGEFLTREFSNTYEDLHAERLGTLSKSQLIQDYVQLEGKVDMLEKRLQKYSGMGKEQSNSNSEVEGEIQFNAETQKNMEENMHLLVLENERLNKENARLRLLYEKVPSVSSVDSESDSTDSSCSSSSDSEDDSEMKETTDAEVVPAVRLDSVELPN